MKREEVLELIETIVRPLREKIEHLEKENEKLKIQITPQSHQTQRQRSVSRQQHRIPKKEESVEGARSPSIKKKDEKPVWNPTGRFKQEGPIYKSPPPVDKNKIKPASPKVVTRTQSKQKHDKPVLEKQQSAKKSQVEYLSFEKPEESHKKIKGGQKFSEENSNNESHLKTQSIKDNSKPLPKHNLQNASSQQHSSHGGSQLLTQEQQTP